jgi:hypothetical protein
MSAGAQRLLCVLCASAVLSLCGCKRKHQPVEVLPELGYPACAGEGGAGDGGAEGGTVVARGHIRGGPLSHEKNVAEWFTLARTACGYTFVSRQEWPLSTSDVEIHYDAQLRPLWAWKRLTLAGSTRADGNADIRRYELRTGEVFVKKRDPHGVVTLEKLLPGGRVPVPVGARTGAIVGPGRGVITAWLRQAKLPVGGKTSELVLDFRDMIESLEVGTLERQEDLYEPSLGRKVRVYTFFGRETVFADDDDVVIGDLAGMRPSDTLTTPEPERLPTFGGADPAHTP